MPKVIQFNPVVIFGSTGRIVEQLGHMAIKRGWESYIVYSGRYKFNESSSRLIKAGSKLDSVIHAIETRLFDNNFASNMISEGSLLSVVIDSKLDW